MVKEFARLTALITVEPECRPATVAEARELVAQISKAAMDASVTPIAEQATAVCKGIETWLGPHDWVGGKVAIAAEKAKLLSDLLKLHGAILHSKH